MKLNLLVSTWGSEQAEKIAKGIESEIGDEVIIKDSYIQLADPSNGTYDLTEWFDVAYRVGRSIEKAEWTKPETFDMQNKFAEVLKTAISNYTKRSMISVNSIDFTAAGNNTKVIVHPTQAVHLFNIAMEYGKLCERMGDGK